jgi:hypothetical protein
MRLNPRWVALNNILQNGDYVDEVFFYTKEPPAGSASTIYFGVHIGLGHIVAWYHRSSALYWIC